MKKLKYFLAMSALIGVAFSCSEDFITLQPEGSELETSYYTNETEAYSALISVYDIMKKHTGGFENMVTFLNAGSDDFYAGGGGANDGTGIQSFSNYSLSPATMPKSYWSDYFQGIFRANLFLSKITGITMDENKKARFIAEAKGLRAYYYFELVRTFKNVPLFTAPIDPLTIYDVEQATPEEVYAQIETDLTEAMDVLPATLNIASEGGRLSKGAVQALLGKVYLYEGKNSQAAEQFAVVNGTPGGTSVYGYHLLASYGDLWNPANKFNAESILEAVHVSTSRATWDNWGSGSDEGNSMSQMIGPRGFQRITNVAPDLAGGWSFNTVTDDLYNAMEGDPRFQYTILDMEALSAAGAAGYSPGYMDTGHFLKKYLPLTTDRSTSGGTIELNYGIDSYIIRLADTYLMEAEALGGSGQRAQALLDAVRARVGLTSVPVSIPAIMSERRLELAGEGHRWFDLVRTGQGPAVLGPAKGFTANKNEIWPIPLTEIGNTKILQNPNY
ncbi:RagB/SusD family nutrient uptake outer membrane protein [Flavobacterium pallidum]|uniref:RagB/SusD family nutrient uptake outer membrane protein n=1 Tax=Flavobacterium pallidum TaxID=2172098 RepID=A0A2S1SGU7_9FLAO|nr:RagB/SusD family nutrient uptake outer membrane protein [Flavobacterium pallidum]AWI25572.1 RagB/SusD family nutrient uptake outer membrane protein [Flavobacterium pallidum]